MEMICIFQHLHRVGTGCPEACPHDKSLPDEIHSPPPIPEFFLQPDPYDHREEGRDRTLSITMEISNNYNHGNKPHRNDRYIIFYYLQEALYFPKVDQKQRYGEKSGKILRTAYRIQEDS